jgi:hypothetical protein
MKNFLLSPEGLKQIDESDLLRFKQGSTFMSPGGPALLPTALLKNEADAMAELLGRCQNFTYWLTPDFRILFTTKDGFWKIVFEWRQDHEGKNVTMRTRVDKRVGTELVLPGVEAFLAEIKKAAEALQAQSEGAVVDNPEEVAAHEARIHDLLQDEDVTEGA